LKKFIFYLLFVAIIVLAGYWIWLGVHTIPEDKTGVAFLLGKPHRVEMPGRHWFFYKPVGNILLLPAGNLFLGGEKFVITREGMAIKVKLLLTATLYDPLIFARKNHSLETFRTKLTNLLIKKISTLPLEVILERKVAVLNADVRKFLSENGMTLKKFDFKPLPDREIENLIQNLEKEKREEREKIIRAKLYAERLTEEARIYASMVTREAFNLFREKVDEIKRIRERYRDLEPVYLSHPERIRELLKLQILEEAVKKAKRIYITPEKMEQFKK